MKRILGLQAAFTPMTQAEQDMCERGLRRIAEGRTKDEDIRHFAGTHHGPNCKRWKPSVASVLAGEASGNRVNVRIVYVEYDDHIQVILMSARKSDDEVYGEATKRMRKYLSSGM